MNENLESRDIAEKTEESPSSDQEGGSKGQKKEEKSVKTTDKSSSENEQEQHKVGESGKSKKGVLENLAPAMIKKLLDDGEKNNNADGKTVKQQKSDSDSSDSYSDSSDDSDENDNKIQTAKSPELKETKKEEKIAPNKLDCKNTDIKINNSEKSSPKSKETKDKNTTSPKKDNDSSEDSSSYSSSESSEESPNPSPKKVQEPIEKMVPIIIAKLNDIDDPTKDRGVEEKQTNEKQSKLPEQSTNEESSRNQNTSNDNSNQEYQGSDSSQRKSEAIQTIKPKAVIESPIPPELKKLIYHTPESIVYLALEQKNYPPLTKDQRSSLYIDLNKYVDMCLDNSLINEASYVQEIIKDVGERPLFFSVEHQRKRVIEDMHFAENELDAQNMFWGKQLEAAEKQHQVALRELDDRLDGELENLDREWQEPKKQMKYSKPSTTFLNLRYVSQQMIKTRNFDSIDTIGKMMVAKRDEEACEATRRMNEDYRLADMQIRKKYENEKEILEIAYQRRLDSIKRGKERSVQPSQQRIAILQRRDQYYKNADTTHSLTTAREVKTPALHSSNISNDPFQLIYDTPKLKLPKITTINRTKKTRDARSRSQSSKTTPRHMSSLSTQRSPSRIGTRVD